MPPKAKSTPKKTGGKRKNDHDDDSLLEAAMAQAATAEKKASPPKKAVGRGVVEVPPGFTSKEEFYAARRMDFEELRCAAEKKSDAGDPDGALALLKVGCSKSDAPAAMFLDLAVHYQGRHMDEESIAPYKRCLELDPLCIRAAQYLADQLRAFGQQKEAEIYLRNAMLSLKAPRFRRQIPDENYYRLMKRLLIARLAIRSKGGACADQLTRSLSEELKEVMEHIPEDPEALQVLGNYAVDFGNEYSRRFKILIGMDSRGTESFQAEHDLLPALDENGDLLEADLITSEDILEEGGFETMQGWIRTGIEYYEAALKATNTETGKKQRDIDQIVSCQPKGRKKGEPMMAVNNPEGSFYAAEMVFGRIREKLKFSIMTSKEFVGDTEGQDYTKSMKEHSDPRGLRDLAFNKFSSGLSGDADRLEALKLAEEGTAKSMKLSRWATAVQCLHLSVRISFSRNDFEACARYGNQLVDLEEKLKRGVYKKEFPAPGYDCLDFIEQFASLVEGYYRTSLWKCAVIEMFLGNSLARATEYLSLLRLSLLRDSENTCEDVHAYDRQCHDLTRTVSEKIFDSPLRELQHHFNELSLGPRHLRPRNDESVIVFDEEDDDEEEAEGSPKLDDADSSALASAVKKAAPTEPSSAVPITVRLRDLEGKELNIRGYVEDELGRFLKKFAWKTKNLPRREPQLDQQRRSAAAGATETPINNKSDFCVNEVFSKRPIMRKQRSIDAEDKSQRTPTPSAEQLATMKSLLQSNDSQLFETATSLLNQQLSEVPVLFPSAFCDGAEVHFTRSGKPLVVPLHEIVPQLVNLSHSSASTGEFVIAMKRLRRMTTESVKSLLELLLVACDRGYVPERGLRRAPLKTFEVKINGVPADCVPELPEWLPQSAAAETISSLLSSETAQGIIEVRPEVGMSLRFWGLNSNPSEARLRFVALEGFHKRRKDVVYQFSEVAAYPQVS